MKVKTTAERLREVMEIKKLKQADIVRLCQPYCAKMHARIDRSDLSQYVSGKYEPSQFKISMLAQALDVDEAWLMGCDCSMERRVSTMVAFTDDEKEIIEIIKHLPYNKRKIIFSMIKGVLSNL